MPPPGIARDSFSRGAASQVPLWQSSNCLWASYEYSPPALGNMSFGSIYMAGQEGWNKQGDYYVWNRRLNPVLGRFSTPDAASDPGWNLQLYGLGDPVNLYDPEGLGVVSTLVRLFGDEQINQFSDADLDAAYGNDKDVLMGMSYGARNAITLGFYADYESPDEFAKRNGCMWPRQWLLTSCPRLSLAWVVCRLLARESCQNGATLNQPPRRWSPNLVIVAGLCGAIAVGAGIWFLMATLWDGKSPFVVSNGLPEDSNGALASEDTNAPLEAEPDPADEKPEPDEPTLTPAEAASRDLRFGG